MKSLYKYYGIAVLALSASCTDILEEETFSELEPETFLATEKGIRSLLGSAYSSIQVQPGIPQQGIYALSGLSSGEVSSLNGSIEIFYRQLSDFTWDSNNRHILGQWDLYYAAIRDANVVLSNIDNGPFSEDFKTLITAEARFIRGYSYSKLYNLFGPVPLYKDLFNEDLLLPRSTEAEIESFIEQELIFASTNLPIRAIEEGRATKGAALGTLCKHYLNTKEWQKSAEKANEIISLGVYELLPDYEEVFSLDNEINDEMVWALPHVAPDAGNQINALTYPSDFPRPGDLRLYPVIIFFEDEFVLSFEDNDARKNLIVTEYTNTAGDEIQLFGNDRSFPAKYPMDPNGSGDGQGNDIPDIRYSDILLSRAEALNELNGPVQESIDLINQVRSRAGASEISLADFSKQSLKSFILDERKREFFWEGKGREDQLRQDVFISKAVERGKLAQTFHVLFPIPQINLDANPKLVQNEGY
ncbi:MULTISPECIES: RagB/SusD family nutrient uptake outer membrane protein [Flavobacteriaceae]|jgi:hypothetical protein|uniref:RagB/SusD family nutrient uptake outer membrane protein n=5 Tax=Flavobacteriaceae TaxID=49546 RepID=A0ABU7IXD1_9FLAO|nr:MULTISPECIES: RagB/SusD family nutrient uptake outer membrane protein [Flavobacteriaceae]MAO15465.1 RagB/SusD family nutrient uptake outer membrane protein [Allomuricauda sp.]MBW8244986.1 RagB/SusD family nutrient uptake outer membrane protein [Allomuricauda oceani]MDC6390252.1 RagB/SusD family nutrient uptake outer membrane protein [Maribacter sp. PR1]MEE1977642.1 RagB/SusD family nutrient uptake outer membrane protein [Maribacter cobaltidurans]NDV43513.1 RagB/SusD family nutrient uptake o